MGLEGIEGMEGIFHPATTKAARCVFETRVSFFCLYTIPIFSSRQLDQASMKRTLHTLHTLRNPSCVKIKTGSGLIETPDRSIACRGKKSSRIKSHGQQRRRVHQLRINQRRYRRRRGEEIVVVNWPCRKDDLIELLHAAGIMVPDRSKESLSKCLMGLMKLFDEKELSITRRGGSLR